MPRCETHVKNQCTPVRTSHQSCFTGQFTTYEVLRYAILTMFPLRPLTIMTRVQKYAEVSAHNISHEVNLSCNIAQFCNNLASFSLQAACSAYEGQSDQPLEHFYFRIFE
jgi:hypothetical protein